MALTSRQVHQITTILMIHRRCLLVFVLFKASIIRLERKKKFFVNRGRLTAQYFRMSGHGQLVSWSAGHLPNERCCNDLILNLTVAKESADHRVTTG